MTFLAQDYCRSLLYLGPQLCRNRRNRHLIKPSSIKYVIVVQTIASIFYEVALAGKVTTNLWLTPTEERHVPATHNTIEPIGIPVGSATHKKLWLCMTNHFFPPPSPFLSPPSPLVLGIEPAFCLLFRIHLDCLDCI